MCNKEKLKKVTDDVVKAVLLVSKKVNKIILYGSQARGDSTDGSDIDILVIVDEPKEALYKLKKAMWRYTNEISLQQDERDGIELYGRAG